MCAKCNEEELFEIVEQILLDHKVLDDFQGLDSDDASKISVLVNRGLQALSEYRYKKQVPTKKSGPVPVRISRQTKKEAYTYIPTRTQHEVYMLASRFGLEHVSLVQIVEESAAVRKLALEEHIRKFSNREMGLLFSGYPEHTLQTLFSSLSKRKVEDIRYFMEIPSESIGPLEMDFVQAKSSLLLVTLLKNSTILSSKLKKFIAEYRIHFTHLLDSYCKQLCSKLGVIKHLNNLDEQGWTKLAGVTPRNAIAHLFFALPSNLFSKLLSPIPFPQKNEIKEEISHYKTKLHEEFTPYGEVIDTVKNWFTHLLKIVE